MPIAPLRVQMLGGFTIRREDAEASVNQRSRKLCLLLACLIQARSRPVPYSELAGLLWKEPSAGSLNMLKAVLHRARACLDQLEEGAGRELLLSREGCCQWNPEAPLTLDAEEFVRLCREGGQAGGEEQRLTLWRSALELYRGDFLPGLSAHPWASGQAAPLRQTFLQTLQRLLPLLSAREEWPEVERLAGNALLLEPCRLERKEEAGRLYEDFHQRLLSRQGVLPSEPLRELYHQAREELDPRSISPVILQEQLGEADQPGPFFCEYDFFRAICRSVSRMAERTGAPLHAALLSLAAGGDAPLARHSLDRAMNNLKGLIAGQLRRGDAFTRCSASQFALLLPQASYENSRMVCARITRAFVRQYPHSPASLQSAVLPLLPAGRK